MNTEKYLKAELKECFEIIDTLLESFYLGKNHIYKPLAGQLRIMLCKGTGNRLLHRVYPKLILTRLKKMDWSKEKSEEIMMHDPSGKALITRMPFEFTSYSNGLVVADLLFDKDKMLEIQSWKDQVVTHCPTSLTINDIIIHIADKGGGSHMDNIPTDELNYMKYKIPTGQTYAEMFIIALARTVQQIGENLFNYEGSKVPFKLLNDAHEKYNIAVVAHKEKAASLSNYQPKNKK